MKHRCMSCMKEYDDKYKVCPTCGFVRGTQAAEPHHMPPETILHKKYIVGKVLGFGGFGVTYIAWDAMLNQKVAIKEYLPSEFATRIPGQTEISVYDGRSQSMFTEGLQSFIGEAQRLAKFNSDGIVKIYDTFRENNTAYIVMEYLEGQTVAQILKEKGPMPYDMAKNIIASVLSALAGVHSLGIIHRDISPDNIFIGKDGKVKILDFGSARYATAYNSKSLSVILKRGYAPPEQYMKNGDQGPWTDNYAVAATLYKMLTGTTPVESIDRKDHVLPLPSAMGIAIPQNSENALMNGLNLDPKARPQTADEFLNGLISGAARVNEKKSKDKAKFPLWLLILCASVATIAIVVGVLFATGTMKFVNGRLIFPNAPVADGYARVPDVLSQSRTDAEKLLKEKELEMLITGQKEYEEIDKDLICEQSPEGGEKVEVDTTVKVKISTGPKVGYVPGTLFYTKEEAIEHMEKEGFEVKVKEEHSDEVGFDGVISQSEDEDTRLKQKEKITIIVSVGPKDDAETVKVEIGNLVGKDFEEARKELLKKGVYLVIEETKYTDEYDEDVIMAQSATGKVNKGDTVKVTVSLGKEMVRVPNVLYKSEAEAKRELEKLGLEVKTEDSYLSYINIGLVSKQEKAEGTEVEKGSTFTITVNRGFTVTPDSDPVVEVEPESDTTKPTTETTTKKKEVTISGYIKSTSGSKISNASVKLKKNGYTVESTKTNSNGWYSISVEKGEYKIQISKDGYETKNVDVTLNKSDSKNFNLTPIPTYTVSGTVKDESDNALSGVTVKVKNGSSVKTGANGKYSFWLKNGSYTLTFSKSGYNTKDVTVKVNGSNTTKDIKLELTPTTTQADKYTVSGTITDSRNNYLKGVTVTATPKSGGSAVTATTDSSGKYSLSLKDGKYTLKFSLSGYVTVTDTITVDGDDVPIGVRSLALETQGDDIKIILNWGASPSDLDAHCVFNGNRVYFSNKKISSGDTTVELDYDYRHGNGPETMIITNPGSTTYTYSVRNYSGSPSITTSGATVTVYKGNTVVATYRVPTSGEGLVWNVFSIQNGQITTINTISN